MAGAAAGAGLSLALHKPLIYPRKEVKAHGARRLIEGDFNEGDTVVVVDDILITGGSKGIGLTCAQGFLAEGARVTLVSRSAENLVRAKQQLAQQQKAQQPQQQMQHQTRLL